MRVKLIIKTLNIMRIYEFIEGIKILEKYVPEDELQSFGVQFEHDQIYFGSESWVTDEDDRNKLVELGWYVEEDSWCAFS